MQQGSVEGLKLTGMMAVIQNRLVISYEAVNLTGADVYVLDAIYEMRGDQPVVGESMVYTLIQDHRLELIRGMLEIPHGLQVESPEVPYTRLLHAGEKMRGKINVAIPVPYNNPYDLTPVRGTLRCEHVRLRIGYMAMNAVAGTLAAVRLPGEKLYRATYRETLGAQQWMNLDLGNLSVDVQVEGS